MQAELESLLALQGRDTAILDGKRKITYHERRAAQVQQQIDQTLARDQKLHENLEVKQLEGRRLSEEVDHLDDHIREQERKLAEDIVSFKELDTMKASIEHGHQHIDGLEETALALLDEIEAEAEDVRKKDEISAKRLAQFESNLTNAKREIAAQQQAIAEIKEARSALWGELAEHLKSVYERLKASVDDPLVPVDGHNCGGCHLQLSAQIIKDLHQDISLIRCEHCSRILYIASS